MEKPSGRPEVDPWPSHWYLEKSAGIVRCEEGEALSVVGGDMKVPQVVSKRH